MARKLIKPKKIEITDPIIELEEVEVVSPKQIALSLDIPEEDTTPEEVDEIKAQIININNCLFDIASVWGKIETSEEIRKAIDDLFVRFNTSPKVYTKHDYLLLLKLLALSLLFLYERQLLLGPNFDEIASFKNRILELDHKVATKGTIVLPEDLTTTLPSVDYLDNFVLRWEEF